MMLLSGCSSPIENTQVSVITLLPPLGLISRCHKPAVIGKTPAETAADDVPRLKVALADCASQANDYLTWRAEQAMTLTP